MRWPYTHTHILLLPAPMENAGVSQSNPSLIVLIIGNQLTGEYYIKTRTRRMSSGMYILIKDRIQLPVEEYRRVGRSTEYSGTVNDLSLYGLDDFYRMRFETSKLCNSRGLCSDFSTASTVPTADGGFRFTWDSSAVSYPRNGRR
jgi:hypothetical protein